MPHGGPRIVAQLDSWMRAHGVTGKNHGEPSPADDASDALRTYPEAQCFREALALATASTAASARAIPLLLAQPARISTALAGGFSHDARSVERSQRLARLLHPPRVVAVGAANVGKSSLLNALAGRTVAIAMDFAGTTRDAVAARVELDGLVVDWFDTPGIRCSADEVERAAQALAETLRVGAALLIEICAPGVPSPEIVSDVARLRVCTRIDLDRRCQSVQARTAAVQVSATERIGLNELAGAIRRRLVFDEDLASTEPWIFHSAAL
ncbi:MAG: GTP-binding protein [Phycisphaerales bacterium]|nr:GTP-binding protein [Phycisphaerales bacterium]